MGVIQIRQRSERLGNLGGVRQADTDTGATRAYGALADSIREEGRQRRAMAGELGSVMDGLKDIAVGIAVDRERRDRQAADRYVARFQQGMDAYNNGSTDADGARVKGAMETDFADSGKWISDNVEYRDRFGQKLKDELGMSERAMQIARDRLVGYNLHMQNRWQSHAAKVDDLKAQAAAGERLNAAQAALTTTAIDGDTNKNGADWALSLEEWRDAVENVLDKTHVPEEARPAARRKAALDVCRNAMTARLARCGEDLRGTDGETREAVKAEFDALEADIRERGWEAAFPFGASAMDGTGKTVSDPVRKSLEGADLDGFRNAALKDLDAARGRALRDLTMREHETQETARNKALQTVKQLHLAPVPQTDEAQAAYFDKMGDAYEKMAMTPGLDEATSANYAKTAQSLRFRAVGERNASAAATKAAEKEAAREQRERLKEAQARFKEAQEETFSTVENEFNIGGYRTNDGEWHDMDANEMADRAMKLLNEKKITRVQFNKLMAIQKPKMDEENLAFRDLVLADVKNLLPNVGYRNGRFQFKPTKDVTVTKSTGVGFDTGSRWYWSNPREEYTYGELIKAMNITLKWQQMNKKTPAEAKEHFDDLTKGIIRGHQRATVKDVLEDAEQLNNDWRNLHGY